MAKTNLEDLTISGFSGETICKDPDSIRGSSFAIENLNECTVYVMDHSSQMTVDNVRKSFLFVGPVQGSFFLRDCSDSVICVACRQFRTKNVQRCTIFLYCSSRPSIEYTKEIKLAPYNFAYPHQDQHFRLANLNPLVNDWMNVHDFNASSEVHWTELPPDEFFIENKELLGYTPPINPIQIPSKFASSHGHRPQFPGVHAVVTEESKVTNRRPLFSLSSAIGGTTSSEAIAKTTVQVAENFSATNSRTGEYKAFAIYDAEQSFNTTIVASSTSQQSSTGQIPAPPLAPKVNSQSPPPFFTNSPPGPYNIQSNYDQPKTDLRLPMPMSTQYQPPFANSQLNPIQPKSYSGNLQSSQGGSGIILSVPPTHAEYAAANKEIKLSVPTGSSPGKSYNEEVSGLSNISLYKAEAAPLNEGKAEDISETVFEYHKGKGYMRPKYTPHYINHDLLETPLTELSKEVEKAHDRLMQLEFTIALIFLGLMLHVLLAISLRLIEDWFVAAWGLFLVVYIVGAIIGGVVVIIKWLSIRKSSNLKLQEIAEKVDLKRRELKFYADLTSFKIVCSQQQLA